MPWAGKIPPPPVGFRGSCSARGLCGARPRARGRRPAPGPGGTPPPAPASSCPWPAPRRGPPGTRVGRRAAGGAPPPSCPMSGDVEVFRPHTANTFVVIHMNAWVGGIHVYLERHVTFAINVLVNVWGVIDTSFHRVPCNSDKKLKPPAWPPCYQHENYRWSELPQIFVLDPRCIAKLAKKKKQTDCDFLRVFLKKKEIKKIINNNNNKIKILIIKNNKPLILWPKFSIIDFGSAQRCDGWGG